MSTTSTTGGGEQGEGCPLGVRTGAQPQGLPERSAARDQLVCNAVRHAPAATDGRVALRLTLGAGGLRIEVSDPGRGFEPQIESTSPDGGRGLMIVRELSDRWGIRANPATTVWCMLAGA